MVMTINGLFFMSLSIPGKIVVKRVVMKEMVTMITVMTK